MAGVRGAVIVQLQLHGLQGLPQQLLDAHGRGAAACRGGRGRRSPVHHALAFTAAVRAASHTPCSMANKMKAPVRPNTLNFTQARSLA